MGPNVFLFSQRRNDEREEDRIADARNAQHPEPNAFDAVIMAIEMNATICVRYSSCVMTRLKSGRRTMGFW